MGRVLRLPLEQLQPYLLELPPEAKPIDFVELFGNANAVEMEVGFGKGMFLLTASEARPDVNFLGLEIERKYVLFTANRIAKRQRRNVRLACADARTFLPQLIPDESLQAVHVYFPDPWWKNRHRKRRLFTAEFASQCPRVLKPGGHLHLVSDVADYFEIMTGLLAQQERLELAPGESAEDKEYLTNFDRKYRQEGRPIHRARYVRC